MYSCCLAASKFIFTENQFRYLVRSNIFTENALHSQATQFSIRFLNCKHVDNESIPHSFTKETKPSKKIHQIRSNWDHAVEARLSGGKIEQRGAAIDEMRRSSIDEMLRSTIGAVWSSNWSSVYGHQTGAWGLPVKSLLPLSLRTRLSLLSLTLSLSENALMWK